MNKKNLSELDICTKCITPTIRDVAGWNYLQFFEEFTLGRIHMRGKSVGRGVRDRADYILFYKKHLPLAIFETWCEALEAQLKSAEEKRGRLVESVLTVVGG